MPSMIIRVDDEMDLIKLAVWPFGIDITYETDTLAFFGRPVSLWLYHLYDNNIRIIVHFIDPGQEDVRTINSEYIDKELEFSTIDIKVDPQTFYKYFESNELGKLDEVDTLVKYICNFLKVPLLKAIGELEPSQITEEYIKSTRLSVQKVNFAIFKRKKGSKTKMQLPIERS